MNKLLVGAALALGSSAQNMMNLTGLLASEGSLSGLTGLLAQYPSLARQLGNAENVTLLAPNNAAIQQLTQSGMLDGADEDTVSNILMYHVIPEVVYSSNFSTTPAYLNTDLTDSSYTNVTDGQVVGAYLDDDENAIILSGLKQEAQVVQADLNYTNGVVHIIDEVLTVPYNISTTAKRANLTALAGSLIVAGLTETLNGLSDVTVFAPSNAAFLSIGSAAANLSQAGLSSILEYHVLNGTIAYAASLGNGSVPTLAGPDVNITVIDGAVFINAARVINADILVGNGVMHVIDSVLNPNSTAQPMPDDDNPTVQFSSVSSASLGAVTASVSGASSINSNLATTTEYVVSGYTTVTEGPVGTNAGGSNNNNNGGSSSSSGIAPVQTAMVGAAALFGGAALMANW